MIAVFIPAASQGSFLQSGPTRSLHCKYLSYRVSNLRQEVGCFGVGAALPGVMTSRC